MSIKELINHKIDSLSENEQKKILDLINLIEQHSFERDCQRWNQFSLEEAMRDLENDELPEYTEADLIEKWQ